MEVTKKCFKCGEEKPYSEYYKHKGNSDGHLGKCKICTKNDVKKRINVLMSNEKWVEKERNRTRIKYHRLNYKELHKPNYDYKKASCEVYSKKYPEKRKAHCVNQRNPLMEKGYHLHHWSYNTQHHKDIIKLTVKDHLKIHRFIIYDQERYMYRRIDNNELLDSKKRHYNYIKWCLENKED